MTRIISNYQQKIPQGQSAPAFGALKLGPDVWQRLVKVSKGFNTPEQRMVIGGSAVFLQPLIDLSNKKVDDETKQSAASRSFSRAIIGTLSGVAVRYGCIALGNYLTKPGKFCHLDVPMRSRQLKNYSKTIGNVLALATLVATNFLIDVPFINKMSNWINKTVFGHKQKEVKK